MGEAGSWELSFFETSSRLKLHDGERRIILRPLAGMRVITSIHLLHALNRTPGISYYALAKLLKMDVSNCRKRALELAKYGLLRISNNAKDARRAVQLFSNVTEIKILLNSETSSSTARIKALGKHRAG